jgi:hypothetical protein
MGNRKLNSCSLVLLLILDAQSLVDIAREEAERRREVDRQGIAVKVIDGNTMGSVPNGNVTTSTGPVTPSTPASGKASSEREKTSVKGFRSSLQKLDREIQKNEASLILKRARVHTEKWANPTNGKASGGGRSQNVLTQLQAEIDRIEAKLKQLRSERFETYEAGKKAGFLPGELEGRGMIP